MSFVFPLGSFRIRRHLCTKVRLPVFYGRLYDKFRTSAKTPRSNVSPRTISGNRSVNCGAIARSSNYCSLIGGVSMRRFFILALFLASPLIAQEPATIQIESRVLGETRTLLVRTPPSYAIGNRTYPVLYMTDGDRQLQHTVAMIDFLAREGRMPEMIVVAIA